MLFCGSSGASRREAASATSHHGLLILRRLWALGALAHLLAFLGGERAAWGQGKAVSDPRSLGTRQMEQRIRETVRQVDPLKQPYMNATRAKLLRAELEASLRQMKGRSHLSSLFDLQTQYSLELLNAGQTSDAIREFSRLISMLKSKNAYDATNRTVLRTFLATCYLRQAEQENCLTNHTSESCLMPIRPGGVHRLRAGGTRAVQILLEQLREFPDDLRARWLLNIAYMTLGEHPDKVPPQWLIPVSAFDSDYDIKRFPDVAGAVALDLDTLSGGVIADDFDEDGDLDLFISARGELDQLRYFRNEANGTFLDRTQEAGLIGLFGGLNLVQADYNNDGLLDVFVMRGAWLGTEGHFPQSLLRNNGDGTFADVTEAAGVLSPNPTQAAVWLDFNNDGWIDLFIGNESTPGDTNRCALFRNNQDGTFTECAAQCGVDAIGYVKAVGVGDYNNDGWPDLYLSARGEAKILYRNEGPQSGDRSWKGAWRFKNVAADAGVREPLHSFPTWFFDYDNDGWQDIFVCGYQIKDVGDVAADYLKLPHAAQLPKLYRNRHDGTFEDVTTAAKLDRVIIAMAGNFGDLDNDGWLDFYLGTGDPDLATLVPNRMLRNDRGQRFQDVTTSGGFGHLQKGHGITFADLDNDGDQDIYSVMGGALEGDHYRNVLFENPGHGNRWVKLKLRGTQSNRAAIGARIRVVVKDNSGERTLHRTVSSGGSFGASPLRQEVGLGQAEAIVRVEVGWPTTGKTQILQGLKLNRTYQIVEGMQAATELPAPAFKLGRGTSPKHQHGH